MDENIVLFVKQIKAGFADCSNLDAWLVRHIHPFPPTVVPNRTYCAGEFIETVIDVEYILEGHSWITLAFTEPEDELYQASANRRQSNFNMDQLIEKYLKTGWNLIGYGPHPRHVKGDMAITLDKSND